MAESFEQAYALEPAALRTLFEHGRPEQRMWAIWVLALRADTELDPEQRIAVEPDAGVRRSLAVMLAGQGKGWLVLGLARHDPELFVRETAAQLAARLACGGALDAAMIVRLCQKEPALAEPALGGLGPGAPEPLVSFARDELARGGHAIQLEAFEALVRIGGEARYHARTWMVPRRDIEVLCDRWLRAADAVSLADAFAGAVVGVRKVVLSRMRGAPWDAVARLIGNSKELTNHAMQRRDLEIPARVLAQWILHHRDLSSINRLAAQLSRAATGRPLLAELRTLLEREPDPSTLRQLLQRARAFARALEVPDAAGVIDELAAQHPVEQLVGLENAIARWLAAVDAPADLIPLLPELHAHVRRRLATLPDDLDSLAPGVAEARALTTLREVLDALAV